MKVNVENEQLEIINFITQKFELSLENYTEAELEMMDDLEDKLTESNKISAV